MRKDAMPMRYAWLDGLRGLAALYVMLHHAYLEVPRARMRWWFLRGNQWLDQGHFAVAVFIVLSGYCLMLPVARTPDGRIRGGVLDYLRRRARRILPAYYAALALSLVLIALVPALQYRGNMRWAVAIPTSWCGPLIAHLLLIHNIRFPWNWAFNPSMWSVATEWQIYFFFPVLLAMWRREGMAAAIALAFLIALPVQLAMGDFGSTAMCPWYLGLFAFGMAAACHGRPARPRGTLGTITIAVALPAVLCLGPPILMLDGLMGAATAALLCYCARRDGEVGPRGLAIRILECPAALALGAFSYSLYLVHYPLLSLASNLMIARKFGGNLQFLIMILVVCPLVVAVAYVFHRVFERPFLASPTVAPHPVLRGPSRRRAFGRIRDESSVG